jgi:hypothetical protein
MHKSRLILPLVLLIATSLLGECLCRNLAGGGGSEHLLQLAGDNVSRLPETIGAWRMEKSEPLSDDVLQILGCGAQQSRVYVDDLSGEQVALTLLVGAAGPLVAHTPDVCYPSSNFEITEPAGAEVIRGTGARADTFDRATFRSRSVDARRQRVYYAWRKFDGPWQVPANPRLALGGEPMLYKLQLAIDAAEDAGTSPQSDTARKFLADLLPVLDEILVAR